MSLKEYKLRLPLVQSFTKHKAAEQGPTAQFESTLMFEFVIPEIKCERIRYEYIGDYWYETHLFYIEDDEEVARIKAAYANDDIIEWEDTKYDKDKYDRLCKESNEAYKYIKDNNLVTCIGGTSYGITFDSIEQNDRYVSSFKSYLIERYIIFEKAINGPWWTKEREVDRQINIKLHKLWIEKDKVMYKDWALKMQGFDLDKWEEENKEWTESIK